MSNKTNKKKIVWQQFVGSAVFMLIGAICGFMMVQYIDTLSEVSKPLWEIFLSFVALFAAMYVAIFVQIIIHEAGHLIFGLMTGYKFSSFRIMSFMWLKENGKLKFGRLTIAGTGGQCLMVPPEITNGKIPVVLYNLGGSLMNVISSVVFLGLYFLCADVPILSSILIMLVFIGLGLAFINGVPMRMGITDNDGYNAVALGKNQEALRSFWIQMKVNEQTSKGMRLKDMPEEWFEIPSDEKMKNSMVAVMGVFACNRLVDSHHFEEADRLMEHLLEIDSSIVGLHRSLMVCDRIYCEILGENRKEVIDSLLTKEQKKFMKSMKKFPSVLRAEYVYALLSEKDTAKADAFRIEFERCAKTYPYPSDIQSERELMQIAQQKAER